jgi:tetrahydromethanopterin S-methyltransferase subunit G
MAKVSKEVLKRLTAPELREIVREELTAALQPILLKIEEMDKRIQNQLSEVDKRLTSKIDEVDKRLTAKIDEVDKRLTIKIEEMDKRITSEISMLRTELQYAPRVAVLESKLSELEKKLSKTER